MNGREEPFHLRHWHILAATASLFIFALVVGLYEHLTLRRAEWESHFLRMPLWELNEEAGAEVIALIFRSNDYRAIEVVRPDGQVFASKIGEHGLNRSDRILAALGLIGPRPQARRAPAPRG
jgi:hypothetical protein